MQQTIRSSTRIWNLANRLSTDERNDTHQCYPWRGCLRTTEWAHQCLAADNWSEQKRLHLPQSPWYPCWESMKEERGLHIRLLRKRRISIKCYAQCGIDHEIIVTHAPRNIRAESTQKREDGKEPRRRTYSTLLVALFVEYHCNRIFINTIDEKNNIVMWLHHCWHIYCPMFILLLLLLWW